jgi:hypothetical protein
MPAGGALASTVNIAPGLEMTLPAPLVIDVFESQRNSDGPVVVGEIEGGPGYFIAAVRVRTWERNNILWRKLETEIRDRSETGDFVTSAKGSFVTMAGDSVWYRAYEYESRDQNHRQVYFLLKGERSIYWVTLTVIEGVSVDLVIPIAKALIRRARLMD